MSRRLDDWDLADARGETPKPTFTQGARGWQAMEALDPAYVAEVRARLDARHVDLNRQLGVLQKEEESRADAPKPQFGKRIGDHTSDALEVRRAVITGDSMRVQQAEVRRAIAKLDEGTYGRCDACAAPIGEERLEAIPWAVECVACRAKRDRR